MWEGGHLNAPTYIILKLHVNGKNEKGGGGLGTCISADEP